MDEHSDPEDDRADPAPATIECSMCRGRIPLDLTRRMSGRPVCLGCLASWYDEDEKDDNEADK